MIFLRKNTFCKLMSVHIGEFTNARVYKSQFWWKHELFPWFWVAMDLISCTRVLDNTFGPLGVHRVPNLGLRGSKLQLWTTRHQLYFLLWGDYLEGSAQISFSGLLAKPSLGFRYAQQRPFFLDCFYKALKILYIGFLI